MGSLTVRVEQDHLERLVKKPLSGLAELIWNALDADATVVDIDVVHNALDGVESVLVVDNGSGISQEQVERYFSQLGGSWKKTATTTEHGRRLHGQAGQGRWAAYGLGETLRWTTVADRVTGERQRLTITGRYGSLRTFEFSDPEQTSDDPGTRVEVSGLTSAAQSTLMRDDISDELASVFALYLQNYPVSLRWRQRTINPDALKARTGEVLVQIDTPEFAGSIPLTIIEWIRPARRALHICDSAGTSMHEMPPGVHAPGFNFTAYLAWDGFRDYQSELALAELGQEPLTAIIEGAKEELRRYFRERSSEKGAELVKAWKGDGTYPYHADPVSTVDRAERDLFEIMAVTAAPVVEAADAPSRRLSLRLLREAIEKSPSTIHEVLQDVLNLPEDQLAELRDLIERTSLTAVIAAARKITDRLDFLAGLQRIVFDSDIRPHVLERRQLHRILANETWLFREEYALTADDSTLRTALRDHIHLLGRSDLVDAEVEESEVLDEHSRRVVVDLMLSRVVETRRNEREHVVIELKRPTVHIGMAEFSQIQNYATAVSLDRRFANVDTRWEFWIVGDELEPSVDRMANQSNRERGIVVDDPQFVVRAVTWAHIIQDAHHRLAFVKRALEYSTGDELGLDYLRRVHGKYLPAVAQAS